MTTNHNPRPWDVWHARFDYSEGKGYKYRPVIIVDVSGSDSIAMMVTSASNKLHLEHDCSIHDWAGAGLDKPSIARADRIVQIPASYFGTAGYLGHLGNEDIEMISKALNDIVSKRDTSIP